MKKLFWIPAAAFMMLAACKEKDVLIDFGLKEGVTDSTYIGSTETPQNRNVLIEEFTGASCTNCPAGHVAVADIIDKNPDRVVAVAYHTFNAGTIFKPVNKPGEKSLYDFRDSAATDISKVIYGGVSSIPVAGFDRATFGASKQVQRPNWSLEATNRLSIATPANLYLSAEYKADENKVKVTAKVVYTKEVSTKNNLTLEIIESGIIDAQEFSDHVDMEYEHNHILRKILTPFNGYSIIDSIGTKSPGRVYEFSYVFTPADNWKLENCYLVGFVSNNESDNKDVLQAQEVKIKK